ncbi:hypothetical protein V6N12_024842 [Hibiscus sabdariffa]|uniref:Reverse transcriptase zinc-binding domain-containing protein n=1 Tax=Hibiscus sabdariffa TaxID=183260 RepID=A0ABR2BA35_9ROSI
MREGLLTKVERNKRHMTDSYTYQLCHREDESVLHVLSDCPRTRLVWSKLLSPRVFTEFKSLPLKEWVLASINSHGNCSRGDVEWPVRFVVFCWFLWKRWCRLLLDDRYVEREDFVIHGLSQAAEYISG